MDKFKTEIFWKQLNSYKFVMKHLRLRCVGPVSDGWRKTRRQPEFERSSRTRRTMLHCGQRCHICHINLISLIGGRCAGFSMSHLSAGSNSPGHRKQGHMDLKLEIDALEIGFMKVTLQRLEKCQLMLASCSFMCSMS